MYRLSVPLESQKKNSTCWHASAFMLWRYSQNKTGRAGPMATLSKKWEMNQTITPPEFINLAEKVGLIRVPNISKIHTESSLEVLLKKWGPLWCAGYWYGVGHVIVLTGIDTGIVHLNDPDGGKPKMGTIKWFNEKLASQYVGCLMAKNPNRY